MLSNFNDRPAESTHVVPSSVTVLGGALTATFTVGTVAVGTTTTATITGNFNGPQTATLTINAPTLSSTAFSIKPCSDCH